MALAVCVPILLAKGQADEAKPAAQDLLFDRPQLAATPPGAVLTYRFKRMSNDAGAFGPDLADVIRLSIEKGSTFENRTVTVQMLTGANQRPAGPFEDMTGNPILSLILEDSVQRLGARLGANPRYLKTAIRTALREAADVEADGSATGGHAWRIAITPFKNDPNRGRMAGLDGLTYTFRVDDRLPGQIAEIDIVARDGTGAALFEERVAYDSPG